MDVLLYKQIPEYKLINLSIPALRVGVADNSNEYNGEIYPKDLDKIFVAIK